jgi:hypothetical protein
LAIGIPQSATTNAANGMKTTIWIAWWATSRWWGVIAIRPAPYFIDRLVKRVTVTPPANTINVTRALTPCSGDIDKNASASSTSFGIRQTATRKPVINTAVAVTRSD